MTSKAPRPTPGTGGFRASREPRWFTHFVTLDYWSQHEPRSVFAASYFSWEHELGGRVAAHIASGKDHWPLRRNRAETVNELLDRLASDLGD